MKTLQREAPAELETFRRDLDAVEKQLRALRIAMDSAFGRQQLELAPVVALAPSPPPAPPATVELPPSEPWTEFDPKEAVIGNGFHVRTNRYESALLDAIAVGSDVSKGKLARRAIREWCTQRLVEQGRMKAP